MANGTLTRSEYHTLLMFLWDGPLSPEDTAALDITATNMRMRAFEQGEAS